MLVFRRKTTFFDLSPHVRNIIYTEHFRTTYVHVDFSLRYDSDIEHSSDPNSDISIPINHPDLNLTFTCHLIRQEALPFFYKYALFDLSECCSQFVAEGRPAIPLHIVQNLHRIRGNLCLLACFQVIDLQGLARIPRSMAQLYTFSLTELQLEVSFDDLGEKSSHEFFTIFMHGLQILLHTQRRFTLDVTVICYFELKNLSIEIHIRDDRTFSIDGAPETFPLQMEMQSALEEFDFTPDWVSSSFPPSPISSDCSPIDGFEACRAMPLLLSGSDMQRWSWGL